jgi:hypothetical protein
VSGVPLLERAVCLVITGEDIGVGAGAGSGTAVRAGGTDVRDATRSVIAVVGVGRRLTLS